jgi:hypothetical protein
LPFDGTAPFDPGRGTGVLSEGEDGGLLGLAVRPE